MANSSRVTPLGESFNQLRQRFKINPTAIINKKSFLKTAIKQELLYRCIR